MTKIRRYLFITLALAAPFYYLIIHAGTLAAGKGYYVSFLMWAPGIAALISCLIFQGNLKGLGWKPGKIKYSLFAYCFPLIAGLVVYSFAWLTNIGRFSTEIFLQQIPSSSLTKSLFYMATVGVFYSILTAFGEELGWRGYLAPKLVGIFGYSKAVLISSVIWLCYHLPLILFSDYHSSTPVYYAFIMFSLSIIGVSFIVTWLRLKSDSVWPPVLFHASHNLFIGHVFDPLTVDTPKTEYFTTEFGLGLAVVYLACAFWFWSKRTEI